MNQPLPQLTHLGLDTIEVLGQGGMGVVYRVRDRRLGRDAALKLIRNESGIDPRSVNRFRREVLVTAKLDHPGIPPVYDSGTDPQGQPYMLMRVVEGRPLAEVIKAYHEDFGGDRSRRELLEVLVKICEAVAYAHTQGIVHRDLKPANVMVGRFGEVLVMDWGLARELGQTEAEDAAVRLDVAGSQADQAVESGMTLQGAVVGTPGYMPPEQAEGSAVDERADVFALGAILCCVLTGGPPVRGETSVNRLVATLKGDIHPPRHFDSSVPGELDAIAAGALAAEPNDRTPTVQHTLRDLRAYLAGAEVRAYQYSLRERLLRWTRGHVALLVVAFLLVSLVLALGGAGLIAVEGRRRVDAQAARARVQSQLAANKNTEKERVEQALEGLSQAQDLAARGNPIAEVKSAVRGALGRVRTRFTLNQAARIYEESGAYDEAATLLREAAESYPPGYRELFRLHRLVSRRRGGPRGASEPLKRLRELAVDRGDQNEFTMFTQAQDAHKAGDLEQALKHYARALKIAPRFVWALSNRASIYLKQLRPKLAMRDAQKAIEIDPRFAQAVANRGAAKVALGDLQGAESDFSLAIELDPKAPEIRISRSAVVLARCQRRGGKLSKSEMGFLLREANVALALDPKLTSAYALRGLVKVAKNDLDGALADFTRVIEIKPSADAFVQRGLIWKRRRRPDRADREFVAALELCSDPKQRERIEKVRRGRTPR